MRQRLLLNKAGFTLAELLITLGIIGVVATLILPRVFDFIEEQQFDTTRKVVLKNFGEAVRLISLNSDIRSAKDAEDFVENYLKKELKILRTCQNNNLRDCGIETNENEIFTVAESRTTMPRIINDLAPNMSNGSYIDPQAESYGFVVANGYSANLFYNRNCVGDDKNTAHYVQDRMCVNIIYDLNGLESPNQVGKDIGFVTIFYPGIEMRAVGPVVYNNNTNGATYHTVSSLCSNINKKLKGPDKEEAQAIYINNFALGGSITGSYITTTSADVDNAWTISASSGFANKYQKTRGSWYRCVK